MPNGTWQRVTIKNKQNLLIEGAGRGREGRGEEKSIHLKSLLP